MRTALAVCAVGVVVAPLAVYAAPTISPESAPVRGYTLSALAQTLGATVLTLEGGVVGNQPIVHFTPLQLQGALCAPPNTCIPVDYPALPGQMYNQLGADNLEHERSGRRLGTAYGRDRTKRMRSVAEVTEDDSGDRIAGIEQ